MGGTKVLRTTFLAGGALAATMFGAALAVAQENTESAPQIDFTDTASDLPRDAALNLSVSEGDPTRFAPIGPTADDSSDQRRVELELAAGGGDAPLDVSIAQRASLGANRDGDVDRQGRGSELRVGRGLVGERQGGNQPSTYVFVASDNEALTWQPGSRNEFGGESSSFALQDRVEVGDLSAGVTWERNGVQTSLAYVEREESTRIGNQTYSQDESFTGLTVTMRR